MSKNKDSGIATEHFRVSFQIDPAKSNLEEREFVGMASVFGSLVEGAFQPTIIEEGAFSKTLLEKKGKVPILWQHETREPIGIPLELTENAAGLYIKGKISKTDIGDKALTLLRDGVLRGLSIGFDPIKWNMEKERETDREWDAIRHITELRLWEVSLVTFGADPLAQVTEVRSQGPDEEHPRVPPGKKDGKGFEIQSLICPKDKWDSLADAKKWLKDHGYKTSGMDEADVSWRFRQRNPDEFLRLRTICINPGSKTKLGDCKVKAVGGPLKQALIDHIEVVFEDVKDVEGMAEQIEAIVEKITDLPEPLLLDEALEGKTISKKNTQRIQDGIKALQELLELAEPPEGDDASGKHPKKDERRTRALTAEVELMEVELAEAEANFAQTTTT